MSIKKTPEKLLQQKHNLTCCSTFHTKKLILHQEINFKHYFLFVCEVLTTCIKAG